MWDVALAYNDYTGCGTCGMLFWRIMMIRVGEIGLMSPCCMITSVAVGSTDGMLPWYMMIMRVAGNRGHVINTGRAHDDKCRVLPCNPGVCL